MFRSFLGFSLYGLAFVLLVATSYLDTPSWSTFEKVAYGLAIFLPLILGSILIIFDEESAFEKILGGLDQAFDWLTEFQWPRISTISLSFACIIFSMQAMHWAAYNAVVAILAIATGLIVLVRAGKYLWLLAKAADESSSREYRDPCDPLPWRP